MLIPVSIRAITAVVKHVLSVDIPIIVYTAKVDMIEDVLWVLEAVDGLTVTLHEPADVEPFLRLDTFISEGDVKGKSLRLNVFKGIEVPKLKHNWEIKDNIERIDDYPLPENEVFMRL